MSVGIIVSGDLADAARLEARGVHSLWVGSHLAAPTGATDGIVGLARLGALTRRVTIGMSVLAAPLYPPVVIAKQVADIDALSGGRVLLGVGVGGEHGAEFRAVQVPVSERGRRTDEAIAVYRSVWTAERVSHNGRHYPFEDVRILPQPAQRGGPPVVVAGRKEAAMRRAAILGDGWLPYLYSPERYRSSVTQIRDIADVAGRDLTGFEWLAFLFTAIDDDDDAARAQVAAQLGAGFGQDLTALVDRVAVAGSVSRVVDRVRAFVDAGARHLLFAFLGDDRNGQVDRLLDEVLPAAGIELVT